MSLITIRGQLGSGAPEIGRAVAQKLHFGYADREIVAQVVAAMERAERDAAAKETRSRTPVGSIVKVLARACARDVFRGGYLPRELMPLDHNRYVQALESVVRELARGGSIVIRGWGTQFILKDHPGSLHVLAVAPFEARVDRVMRDLKLDRESACREIACFDTSLHESVRRCFEAELGDPLEYDLVVNTGRLSFEAAVSTIIRVFHARRRIQIQAEDIDIPAQNRATHRRNREGRTGGETQHGP